MITRAVLRYIRITPRKFRQIIPLVKDKNPEDAIVILTSVKKGASKYGIDLLKAAIANAKRKRQGIDVSSLYISKMIADCGPQLKRFRAASMGRATMIRKRTSHLTVELDERMPAKEEGLKPAKEKAAHEKEAAKAKGHPSHAPAADSEKSIASKRAKAKDSVKSEPGKKGKE